jgi:multicomponent Na+:H+ antiporter subunit G
MFFNLAGCLGLIRFPDIYNRLQAGTKCVTFGTIFILLGALVSSGFSATGMKAILCLIFILITSPTAAHAIAKGAHMSGVKLWKKSVVDKYKEDTKDQE